MSTGSNSRALCASLRIPDTVEFRLMDTDAPQSRRRSAHRSPIPSLVLKAERSGVLP